MVPAPTDLPQDWEDWVAQLDIALHTGMRKSEQFGTTWNQVDLQKRFIYLDMTKNGNNRFVHLNKRATAVLTELKLKRDRLGLP